MHVGDEDRLQAPQAPATLAERHLRALAAVEQYQASSHANQGRRETAAGQWYRPRSSEQAHVEHEVSSRRDDTRPRFLWPLPRCLQILLGGAFVVVEFIRTKPLSYTARMNLRFSPSHRAKAERL